MIDQQSLSVLPELMHKLKSGFSPGSDFSIPLDHHDQEICKSCCHICARMKVRNVGRENLEADAIPSSEMSVPQI